MYAVNNTPGVGVGAGASRTHTKEAKTIQGGTGDKSKTVIKKLSAIITQRSENKQLKKRKKRFSYQRFSSSARPRQPCLGQTTGSHFYNAKTKAYRLWRLFYETCWNLLKPTDNWKTGSKFCTQYTVINRLSKPIDKQKKTSKLGYR